MRRVLKRVVLPFVVGLLVAASLTWWLTPQPRAVASFENRKSPFGFSQDGSICCMVNADQRQAPPSYTFCDTQTGQVIAAYQPPPGYRGFRLTPDGTLLTYPSGRNTGSEVVVNTFNPYTQTATTPLKVNPGKCRDIQVSGNGTTVAAFLEDDSQAAIWDLVTGERRLVIDLESRHRTFLSLSDDGRLLAVHEQFKEDLTDVDQSFRIFLFDTQTGQLRDQLDMPESTLGYAYFFGGTNLLALTESKFQVTPSVPGSSGPRIVWGAYKEKYLHVGTTTRLSDARAAFGKDPTGELWLVETDVPEHFQVLDIAGNPRSPVLPLMRQEITSRPWFVPGTSFMITQMQKAPAYPQWAQDLAARVGVTWLSSARRSEVWLIDWRTGARRNLHSTPITPGIVMNSNAYFSLNGRVLSVAYQTETGFRTEFWDFPLAERPWWLITIAAVLGVVGTLVLLSRLGRRRARSTHRTLMATEAT